MLLQFMSAPILESLWLEFDFWYFDTPFEVWILQVSTTTVSDPSRNTPGVQCTISRCFSEHHPSPSSTPYEGPIFQASRNADRSLRSMVLTTHPGLYCPRKGGALDENRGLPHGGPIYNLVDDRDILHAIEREVPIPVETTVQLVSGENYTEPWWNQDRLNSNFLGNGMNRK